MDREYLEDYEQKELSEFERLERRIREGKFSFEKDRFPPDERFVNLQKPVALASPETSHMNKFWSLVPFCGSLILILPPAPRSFFERNFFKTSEIPKIIDFIKETGKLQITLSGKPSAYVGLDYLDSIFKELNPPVYAAAPVSLLGTRKEIQKATETFYTVASMKYLDCLRKLIQQASSRFFEVALNLQLGTYILLNLGHYTLAEDIENLMIDDPEGAMFLLTLCQKFIADPLQDLRSNIRNFTLGESRESKVLPLVYQPQKIRFPFEIGEFLLKKLTYAPKGLRACNELIDHYDAYDLRKVAESLNEAIITNHFDVVNKSAKELSEILDNVWNDATIPKRMEGLRIGIPLSVAAVGAVAAGPVGAAVGGFLAELGFKVADKFIDFETTGLSEKLAKLRRKSYQANVYDFMKKYKNRVVPE